MAHQVDYLYFFLIGTTVFFTILVVALICLFSWRYRRKKNPVATQIEAPMSWN